MHVDFDYFFAQVEERRYPSIVSKPIIVCVYSGRSENSGVVSTSNYLARKYGVNSGMSISSAKNRLQDVDAEFLPVDHDLYDVVSRNIMNIIRKYADNFEQAGVDEAFLEVTESVKGSFEKAGEHASKLKKEILTKERITCSIGIGPNKLVAKIAAGTHKPDGLTTVRPNEVQRFLFPLPVRVLVGVGRKTEKTLQELGIFTVGELAASNSGKLISIFGRHTAMYLQRSALGYDDSPVEQRGRADSISRIRTLKEDTRDLMVIRKEIGSLAEDLHSTIIEQGLNFKSVSITAVMNDLNMLSRSKTLANPTENLEILKKTTLELFWQLLKNNTERSVRRAGVKISNFIEAKGQKQLVDYS